LIINTTAPASNVRADSLRRTITGMVVPWGTYARVSTGQTVAFARGSLALSERAKLVIDHDPGQPVAVYLSATDTDTGLEATFRVPAGPRGDQILAEASEGLRDGFSVSADVTASDERDDGVWVTAARGRHVALLSEPAFDAARVSAVTASSATEERPAMTVTEPAPVVELEAAAPPVEVVTAAGTVAATVPSSAPARVRDPYPYAQPHELGGPSFVRDALASWENPGSIEAERWRRAQMMASDPALIRAGQLHLAGRGGDIEAAVGTSVTDPALTPPRWLPGRFVPLIGAKAPLYSVLAKYGTPDFNTLELPRTVTETNLSGLPADEVTPVAPGDIATNNDTVTIVEVEGSYQFSRRLLMGSNPAIDRIALDAMERAWLADVETRATAFFTNAANSTAWSSTYADGLGFINSLRALFAAMAAGTLYTSTDAIPATKEYVAASAANDTTGRGLLPYGPRMNSAGSSEAAFSALEVQGVPLWPGPYMPANKTLVLDQSINAAVIFATPVMNFRFESTTTAGATTENVKVLQLTKYSGVGFWSQYKGGIHVITNTTPLPFEAGGLTPGENNPEAAAAEQSSSRSRR
jgi:phage head maturation protease